MKKRSKVLLANLALFVVFFTGTALVGGFHHSTFIRFAPVGTAEFQSVIAFIPDLSVTHFGSRYDKALIPFILYTHGREDEESYITIQTEHENDAYYGYDVLSHLKITNLAVITGEKKEKLITADSPVQVHLNTERWASRSKKLGRCEENEVEIEALGIAYTQDGQSHEFWYKQKWKKVRSNRWDIGLGLMP